MTTPPPCAHAGRPCSPVPGDCLCPCQPCSTRRGEPAPGVRAWAALLHRAELAGVL